MKSSSASSAQCRSSITSTAGVCRPAPPEPAPGPPLPRAVTSSSLEAGQGAQVAP